MTVYKHTNGKWYCAFQIRGKRYHKAIPEATNKKEAQKYETVLKSELLRGRLDLAESIGNKPFTEIANLYIKYAKTNLNSSYSAIKIAERFKSLWQNKKLSDITPKIIEQYKEARLNTIYSTKIINNKTIHKYITPATVNRETGVLSKMFSLAIANNYIKTNPVRAVKKLKVTNKIERHLSVNEEHKLIAICNDDFSFLNLPDNEQQKLQIKYKNKHSYLEPILIMALNTSMRKSEILNMTWDCVDFKNNEISALNTKNGKKNTIPMSNKLHKILKEIRKKEPHTTYVFTNPKTNTKYQDITKSFKTICKLANIKNLRFHDLRHTGATRMVASGIPLPIVKEILNHAKIQTTMRYAHTIHAQKISAIEALSNYKGV